MIIYTQDNNLITTSLGNVRKNIELMSINFSAAFFEGRENRFFKIISKDVVTRSIKHITSESMILESIKRFRRCTHIYDSHKYYDKENNIGYDLRVFMKHPTFFTYSMAYPAITEFFQYWNTCNDSDVAQNTNIQYDLSKLFVSMENFSDLELLFKKEEGELLQKILYQDFPEFAIFYYEIYPHLNLEITGSYDITKLVNARKQVYELGLDTKQIDEILDNVPVAQNNTKVLQLLKNSK